MFVRMFPHALDSKQYNTSNRYYAKYGTNQSGGMKSGNQASASSGSRLTKEEYPTKTSNTITFTKTFEIRHGDDEEHLVPMDELSSKGQRRKSTGSSETSVRGPVTPTHANAPRGPA